MSAIPTAARAAVRERQDGQCARCGNLYTEIHHRQRRRDGGHGLANLVGLCHDDHKWVHANPKRARDAGYIVSAHVEDVALVPVATFAGSMFFEEDGSTRWAV